MAGALAVASGRKPGRSVGTRARPSGGAGRRRPCRGLRGRAHDVAPAMPAPLQRVPGHDVEGTVGLADALAQNCKLLISGKAAPRIRKCNIEVSALSGKLGGRRVGRRHAGDERSGRNFHDGARTGAGKGGEASALGRRKVDCSRLCRRDVARRGTRLARSPSSHRSWDLLGTANGGAGDGGLDWALRSCGIGSCTYDRETCIGAGAPWRDQRMQRRAAVLWRNVAPAVCTAHPLVARDVEEAPRGRADAPAQGAEPHLVGHASPLSRADAVEVLRCGIRRRGLSRQRMRGMERWDGPGRSPTCRRGRGLHGFACKGAGSGGPGRVLGSGEVGSRVGDHETCGRRRRPRTRVGCRAREHS